LIQDVVSHHNVASNNPSKHALMMRTPFIYAGIAMSQNLLAGQRSIDNPSREFARMYANRELDLSMVVYTSKLTAWRPLVRF